MGDILEMGDSPPPGYSGGSVLQTPATEIPMTRVQGGGGSGGGDVFGETPNIPIQKMVGGHGNNDDDVVTEAVIAHIIAAVLLDEENKEPVRNLKATGKQTKLLWNYSGKNRIRVRTNLTDAEIKAFLTLKPEAFQLDELALFNSLFFSEDDVRKYLLDHQDEFVRFWRRFIEYDGTDPVILYTTKEGRFYQDFLKNIANVRLKNLLGNVAYLLPAHKRSAYVDPGNLVLGKQEQKTVNPPTEILPTKVEKTKFTEEDFNKLIQPIEDSLAVLDDKDMSHELTIENFHKVKKFVEVYDNFKTTILTLKGKKGELEEDKKENEPIIKGFDRLIQSLTGASTQDRNYIAELRAQKEALEQINTGYTLYMSDIDNLVERANIIINTRKDMYTTLKGKLEKMFKEPNAPVPPHPPSSTDKDSAAAGTGAGAAAGTGAGAAAGTGAGAAAVAKPGKIRRTDATEKHKADKLKLLKENVSTSTDSQQIITNVLKPFFNGQIWTRIRGTYGESGFLSNFFWEIRQKSIISNGQKYTATDNYKTKLNALKDDTAEVDLWKYLNKLLFLEEYNEEQIKEIKGMLKVFIDVKEDYIKMAQLYNLIYTAKTEATKPPHRKGYSLSWANKEGRFPLSSNKPMPGVYGPIRTDPKRVTRRKHRE